MNRNGDGWGIRERRTGKWVLFDGRMPFYWLRSVARNVASEHNWTSYGKDSDVEICRITVKSKR
jgi:hypothetical protein